MEKLIIINRNRILSIKMSSSIKHVVCAISGGVDSAVTAFLLKKEGYRVTGCFMRNWNRQEELFNNCDSEKDQEDAQHVCQKLDIPLISVDFSKSYWNKVFRCLSKSHNYPHKTDYSFVKNST